MQWVSDYTHNDERSESGLYHHFEYDDDPGDPHWVVTPLSSGEQHHGEAQEREESGEEWTFGHCNFAVEDATVAYVTAGYSSWPNCFWKGEGCTRTIQEEIDDVLDMHPRPGRWAPTPGELELPDRRKGETRGTVAMVDLKGHEVWYRHLLPGLLYNAVQDAEGNIVVVGHAYSNVYPDDIVQHEEEEEGDERAIHWNDETGVDVSTILCSNFSGDLAPKMGVVVKLDPEGNILWTTFVSAEVEYPEGLSRGSLLEDIVEVPGQNGPEYLVVGYGTTDADDIYKPMVARLSEDGVLIDVRTYTTTAFTELPATWPLEGGSDQYGWFTSISYDTGVERAFISGWYNNNKNGYQAIGMLLDPGSGTPFEPLWLHATGDDQDDLVLFGGHSIDSTNYTTGGGFVNYDSETKVIWPILGDFTLAQYDIFAGFKEADLSVHELDLSTGDLEWTKSLGPVRAYDLQADITATIDHKVAVVSSKWVPLGPDDEFDHEDLPPATVTCLQTEHGYIADGSGDYENWEATLLYNYWNTDAYVAKLDPSNGDVIWETTWDADRTTTFECPYGDARNQECVYKITEAPDGGLVISGNTSHNFDDYYLVKLYPDCQSPLDQYDETIVGGLADGVYTLPADETWSTNKKVIGTIVIPYGKKLTINGGARIEFADSRQLTMPTRIIVEAGGTLDVNDDALLTSMPGCNEQGAMWDGIIVQGDLGAIQEPVEASEQGYVHMDKAAIENARVGISVAEEMLTTGNLAEAEEISSGGIVVANQSSFRNCIRDVAFSPFENHEGDFPGGIYGVEANMSRFYQCVFETTATLNDLDRAPGAHAMLFGVRGIQFTGCTFSSTGPYTIDDPDGEFVSDSYRGSGIVARNSTFTVGGHCTPVEVGVPCEEEEYQRNTFTNLYYGVNANTFGDLSRTFVVDRSDFIACSKGIRMEGIQDPGITRNTFDVGEFLYEEWPQTPYGVYSDQCTGYLIEQNAFFNSNEESELRKVGLVIKDSDKDHNKFYNNTFDAFYVGSLIQGNNANSSETVGLEIQCNDYGMVTKCAFDVALTGDEVRIQNTQGNSSGGAEDPAGNRFSLAHDGTGDAEEDWFVEDEASTVADYFHHTPIFGSRTKPTYYTTSNLNPIDQANDWPGKEEACPTHLAEETKEEKRMASSQAEEGYTDSKEAYDATKDDGDTYSLLGYVSDGTKSSAQVRDALESVAPNVSAEVWNAAFDRDPSMSAWHITQALLSNSPLQGVVLKRVVDSELPEFYANLVLDAQTGEANVLSALASGMAFYAGEKAEALQSLGRDVFTDSLGLDEAVDSLAWWHGELPAENQALALSGSLAAKGDMVGLYAHADATELAGDAPELYGLVKRFADGWKEADTGTRTWVDDLAGQRGIFGSAHANAWREAMGEPEVHEIILLPTEERSFTALNARAYAPINWAADAMLEAYPNPANGPVYLVYRTNDANVNSTVRIMDAKGALVDQFRVTASSGIIELSTQGWPGGLFVVELLSNSTEVLRTKLNVQP